MSILVGATSGLAGAAGAAGGGGDLGEPINQSVRFAGDSVLHRNFSGGHTSADTGTISFWAKKAGQATEQTIWNRDGDTWHGAITNSDEFAIRRAGVGFENFGTIKYRDPSAWYHYIISINSATATLYVNGVQVPTTRSVNSLFSGGTSSIRIGSESTSAASSNFDGYLAEFIFVDGQALDEEDFGRFNEDGVWVPIEYTGTFGNNGFHLDFADNSDPGNDVSGNNNDFTAVGFDTADVASYAGTIFTDHVNTGASATPNISSTATTFTNPFTNAFDGNTSTRVYTSGAGSWIIFRPSTAIPMSTGLRIWTEGLYVNQVWLNGSNSSFTSTGTTTWQTIPIGSETQITSIAVQGTPSPAAGANLYAIEVDGTILIHNTDNDVDYLDTPTSNYATFNAALHPNNQTLSNANLTGGTSSTSTSLTTQLPNYKYYWEATGSNYYYGISEIDAVRNSYLGSKSNQVGWFNDGSFWVNASNQGTLGPSFSTTDIAMQCYDPATGKYWVGINGTWHGSGDPENGTNPAFTVGASIRENMVPANNVSAGTASYNFGQMNFLYTKPTGFEALQTNNLPEPTIKNGKKHFGVLTYAAPASPSFPITIDGSGGNNGDGELDFDGQPDLVWMKMRNGGQNNILFDSVRGTSVSLRSDGSNPEIARTNFAFATNGFTFSAQDAESYQQNDNYVAWCWKAGGTAVSNTDGTNSNTVNVSANQDGGFSIVTYTGETSNNPNTIGHGLNAVPEFIIVKRRDAIENWAVYHASLGNDRSLELHDSSAQSASTSAFWNSTTPTSSVFSVGNGGATNEAGGNYVAYLWAPVEGYSKFGSYTGGGSGSTPDYDGPYIHLGFRPAWLLIKRFNAAGDSWILLDSTRDTQNFAFRALKPDTSDQEISSGDQHAIDFLSNGFKCKSSNANINLSGASYVYMAFAESPFGGENAPPATAR